MSILTTFVIGAIAGGVIKWQIDRYRGHQNQEQLRQDLIVAKAKISQLQTELETEASPASKAAPASKATPKDKLDQIKGIGPVFAQRLNQAGVLTLADLAELTPERVREIVSPGKAESIINPQDWITQARQLTGR